MTEFEIAKQEENIQYKKDEIEEKQGEIDDFELDVDDYESQYDDMLDECYPELFNMSPSRILSECDPIMYSCGLNDYIDSLEISDDKSYQLLEEELSELESELQDLEE